MSCCVFGLTTLQLYWNYKNYKTVVANFKKDANNALEIAVDKEMTNRRNLMVLKVKKWLADTAIVKITCDTNNKEHNTAFTITDAIPYYKDEKPDQTTLGIASFKQKLGEITPQAKQIFINHFAERINGDLKDGTTFYYTQGLGHRIEAEFEKSVFSKNDLISFFKLELYKRKITSEFIINASKIVVKDGFLTNKINTAFRRPYDKKFVQAQLSNPNQYYFQEMKWLIIKMQIKFYAINKMIIMKQILSLMICCELLFWRKALKLQLLLTLTEANWGLQMLLLPVKKQMYILWIEMDI